MKRYLFTISIIIGILPSIFGQYCLQVAVYDHAVQDRYFDSIKGNCQLTCSIDSLGFHTYFLQTFKTIEEAQIKAKELFNLGYRNTQVYVIKGQNTVNFHPPVPPPIIRSENKIFIEPIFFDAGSSYLRSSSYESLDVLSTHVINNPNCKVYIETYHDKGSLHSKDLSRKRARKVRDYLTKQGIYSYRLHIILYEIPEKLSKKNSAMRFKRRLDLRILGQGDVEIYSTRR